MATEIFNALYKKDVAALVAIIKEIPTWEKVSEIVGAYPAVVKASPLETLKITQTLQAISQSADAPATITEGGRPTQLDLAYELGMCVHEMLTSAFSWNRPPDGYTNIVPTNEFLITGLISGACERTDLCSSPPQKGVICTGLGLPEYEGVSSAERELYAIHAFLALLVGGAPLYQRMERQRDQFGPALKKIADDDIVKHEGGKRLLKLTIQQVELGFSTDVDVGEIWTTLFPGA